MGEACVSAEPGRHDSFIDARRCRHEPEPEPLPAPTGPEPAPALTIRMPYEENLSVLV
jgi:hypothetical protein